MIIFPEKELGQGSFGKVCLASDFQKQRRFAAKILDSSQVKIDSLQDIMNEIKVLKRLHDSPHVVQLVDAQRTEKNFYIFMELCDQDLLNYLYSKQNRRLSELETGEFIRHICQGFKVMQENNIIHRDIKPANILLKEGVAKITDFGFARFIDLGNQDQPNYFSRKGSPLYMAPQILIGDRYSSKCDVWSVGMMVYEMLYGVGVTPWRGENTAQLYAEIKKKALSFPENGILVSAPMKNLITNMLQIEEAARFSWEQVLSHEVIVNKMYLTDMSGQNFLREKLSNSCALADIYVQNKKVATYLNEIEETFEVPDERIPVFSVQSCQIKEDSDSKKAQLEKLNLYLAFQRNIGMYFAAATQKIVSAELFLNESTLLLNKAAFVSCLVQIKLLQKVQNTLKDNKIDYFPTPVFEKFKETLEYYKISKLLENDLETAQALLQDLYCIIKQRNSKETLEKDDRFCKIFLQSQEIITIQEAKCCMQFIFMDLNNLIKKNNNVTNNLKLLSLFRYLKIAISYNAEIGNFQKCDFLSLYEKLDSNNIKEQLNYFENNN